MGFATRTGLSLGMMLATVALAPHATAASKAPNLAPCPRLAPEDMSWRERKAPLPVPKALAPVLRSSLEYYRVTTLDGGTVCVETRWMEQAKGIALSADGRFLTFAWTGYEAYGFMLVDRTGKGQAIDTGDRPVFSPSGARMAAVELSESGFGSLNAFAVWQVEPAGLRELARVEDLPGMYDWRIESWSGESCIHLSAIPLDRMPEDGAGYDTVPREHLIARPSGATWKLAPAPERGCPSA